MNPAPFLRWSRFAGDKAAHGAAKRTRQIGELCQENGIPLAEMSPPASGARWSARLQGLFWRLRYGRALTLQPAGPGLIGYHLGFYRTAFRNHRGVRVLLWETTYDSILPRIARSEGFRVVALPHNLESLVLNPGENIGPPLPWRDLKAEAARLAMADAVFTIAREEQWLLDAFGVRAGCLPYYPPSDTIASSQTARARRVRTDKPAVLVMGSVHNPPTAAGMREVLAWLRDDRFSDVTVHVAGFNSDRLAGDCAHPRFVLHCEIDARQHDDLLATCSALIAHQIGGAGALTRIAELLAAGVPVLANPNAARSAQGMPGVHVYHDAASLRTLLRRPLAEPPTPVRPAADESDFIRTLRRLAGDNR